MTEAVMLLALATKGAPAPYDEANRCQQPKLTEDEANAVQFTEKTLFLVVGHSFGGRALLRGVGQSMLTLLLERKVQSESCVAQWNARHHADDQIAEAIIVSPLDLIALINPADDAIATKSMIEAFKRSGISDTNLNHPLIVSIKSDGDYTTGWVMKTGQILAGSKPKMHYYDKGVAHPNVKYPSVPPLPSACEQGQLGLKGQAWYYRRSAGGILNMGSHYVAETSPTDEASCHASKPMAAGGRVFWVNRNNTGTDGNCFDLVPVKSILVADNGAYAQGEGPYGVDARQFYSCEPALVDGPGVPVPVWNDTPFYVIHTPKEVIPNHDDIFRKGVFNLLMAMIETRDAAVPVKSTSTVLSTSQAPVTTGKPLKK